MPEPNQDGLYQPSPSDATSKIEPVRGERLDKSRPEAHADRDWARRSFHYFSIEKEWKDRVDDNRSHKRAAGFHADAIPSIIEAKHQKAWRSFTSTELGGNFAINTLYGYTPSCDIDVDRQFPGLGGRMGRSYQERIEDNAHDIHIRLGVQKFNSGISFFSNWFDYWSHSVAVHGRTPSILYELGQVAGVAMGFIAPQVVAVGFMVKFFALLGGGRFWYVSPTMPLYWTAVTNILNEITGAMGLTVPTIPADAYDMKYGGKNGGSVASDRTNIARVSKMLPGVFQEAWGSNEEGFNIDVRRVASRAQSTQNQINRYVTEKLAQSSYDTEKAYNIYDEALNNVAGSGKWGKRQLFNGSGTGNIQQSSLRAYTQQHFASRLGRSSDKQDPSGLSIDDKDRKDGKSVYDADSMQSLFPENNNLSSIGDDGDDVVALLNKELDDGSAWVTLRVDGTKSVSESFSNSSEESQIASMINGWAESRKQLMFNLAGGSIMGETVSAVMSGVGDFVAGAAKGLNISGLTGFMYGAKIDMPRTYGNSTASLPKASYTLKLRTPYNHPLCIAQDLYLPLAMVLGMGLPLSQGRNAWGGPFFCEVYDRGRCVIKCGIVSSISIERATSNVAWTREGFPLGIDINLEIENLDTTIHMPINTMGFLDTINPLTAAEKILIGNEGAMSDYVSTLAALSLPDMVYRTNNLKRNWYAYSRQWSSYWDKDHFVQRIAASAPGRLASLFYPGTDRR